MTNTTQQHQPFKTLQIIHGALIMGMVLFLVLTSSINENQAHTTIEPNDIPFLYIALIAAIAAPIVSNFIFRKKIFEINNRASLTTKFKRYVSACIVRYALVEGTTLLSIVVSYITGNILASVIAVALIIYMIMIRPIKRKVITDLNITDPETME